MQKIIPVILCGGFGKRLWPISSEENPKQFNKKIINPSLFKKAIDLIRCKQFEKPIVVGNALHRNLILEEIGNEFEAIILEQKPNNTLPAIMLAMHYIQEKHSENTNILILTSDHIIENQSAFVQSVLSALNFAKENIVCFGAVPNYAERQYGYIEIGNVIDDGVFEIKKFTEKPNKKDAEEFLKSGNFYWNCGIFLSNCNVLLNLCKEFEYEILQKTRHSFQNAKKDNNIFTIQNTSNIKPISIDYAILEKTQNICIAKMQSPWVDLGNFVSLCKYLKRQNSDITKTERNWGFYEVIKEEIGFKIKKIFVNAQSSLSLQSHKFRSEHWFVVRGFANVFYKNQHFDVGEGESFFIDIEQKHQLKNLTNEVLEIIEVQTGEYLGEDDIIRYELN